MAIDPNILALLANQGPSPLAMGQPGSQYPGNFEGPALNPPPPQTPMRPEDLFASPNPQQPHPPETRMEGYRRMLADFTFSLGSGLTAASVNPRGRALRTQAGIGATLQVPKVLQDQIDAQKLADAQKAQAQANFLQTLGVQKQQAATAAANQLSLQDYRNQEDRNADLKRIADAAKAAETAKIQQQNADTAAAKLAFQKTQKSAEQLKAEQYKYLSTQQTAEGPKAIFQPPNWNGDPSQLVEKVLGAPLDKLSPAVIEDPSDSKRGLKADFNPRTGEYSVNGQVIPNAREFNKPTGSGGGYQLIKTVDENGDSIQMFVPKTPGTTYSSDYTAQEKNRRGQADIIQVEADRIIKLINDNPNSVGPIAGRIARGEVVLGNVDPKTKAIGTALGSFEALQPILHGFRGGSQTVDHFHTVIGSQELNAAALKESLLQVKQLAADIKAGMAVDLNAPAAAKPKTAGAATPSGRIRVVGPNGETGTVLKNEKLPPGWKTVP